MSSNLDDTVLPPKRRARKSIASNGDTVLPEQLNTINQSDNPGDIIDSRYTVIREIGRGGMGVVYEVEDTLLGGRFAIKRLLPELTSRPDLRDVFKREGATAMEFTSESPRFVTMRHVGADPKGLYLVMDYIADPTLRSVLQSTPEGRLDLSTAVAYMNELANALTDLHRFGFVHRDLKPENIFIVRTGKDTRVRLVDFGLTKDDLEGTRTSIRGAGTSGYASPEQRKGLPTTAATDIFAFGVIAYEILTGELPSGGDKLTDYRDDVPAEIEQTIARCLSARRDIRPDLIAIKDVLNLKTKREQPVPVKVPDAKDDTQSSMVKEPIEVQAKPAASTTAPTKPETSRSKPSSKSTVGAKGKDGQDGASAVTTSRQTSVINQDVKTKPKTVAGQASKTVTKPAASPPASPPPKRTTTPSTPNKTSKTTKTDNVVIVNGQRITNGNQNITRSGSSSVSIGSAGQSISVSSRTNGRQINIDNGQVRVGDIVINNGQVRVGDMVVTGGETDVYDRNRYVDDYYDDEDDYYDDDDEDEDDDYYDDDYYDDDDGDSYIERGNSIGNTYNDSRGSAGNQISTSVYRSVSDSNSIGSHGNIIQNQNAEISRNCLIMIVAYMCGGGLLLVGIFQFIFK